MTLLADSKALLSSRLFYTYFIKNLFISAGKIHMDNKDEAKSQMGVVSVPPIVSTYRQALHTFNAKFSKDLPTNLNKLKRMMNDLKASSFGFDFRLSDPGTWNKPNKAPCTYIEVFQNKEINMSIFILKPGFKMPLHDHPHMHGLLKVLQGAVHIRSYTEYSVTELPKNVDFTARAKIEAARLASGITNKRRFIAEVSSDKVCNENSETCVLTPTVSNYHEIEALELPAAFFDILAPPYDTFIEQIGPRRCRYYVVANKISTNLVELKEINVPDCFYCDQAPYLGPKLV